MHIRSDGETSEMRIDGTNDAARRAQLRMVNATGESVFGIAASADQILSGLSDGDCGLQSQMAMGFGAGGSSLCFLINGGNQLILKNCPTTDPTVAGAIYSDGGTLKISNG